MITLKEAAERIGDRVIYWPFLECNYKDREIGVITSVNERFVFVRYGDDVNSKATNPDDLTFESKSEAKE